MSATRPASHWGELPVVVGQPRERQAEHADPVGPVQQRQVQPDRTVGERLLDRLLGAERLPGRAVGNGERIADQPGPGQRPPRLLCEVLQVDADVGGPAIRAS